MIHQILRLFANTLTVDEKHYLLNRDNLMEPINMELSKKQKTFSELFFAYLNSLLDFQHLPIKDDRHS